MVCLSAGSAENWFFIQNPVRRVIVRKKVQKTGLSFNLVRGVLVYKKHRKRVLHSNPGRHTGHRQQEVQKKGWFFIETLAVTGVIVNKKYRKKVLHSNPGSHRDHRQQEGYKKGWFFIQTLAVTGVIVNKKDIKKVGSSFKPR